MALNVLSSIKSYLEIAQRDRTRNGITMKKIVLESVCGHEVRNAQQITLLSEFLGARRKTMFEISKLRILSEENKELALLVEKLGRKPPQGEKYISPEWKIEAGHFYESRSVLVKGHHAIYKVRHLMRTEVIYSFKSSSIHHHVGQLFSQLVKSGSLPKPVRACLKSLTWVKIQEDILTFLSLSPPPPSQKNIALCMHNNVLDT